MNALKEGGEARLDGRYRFRLLRDAEVFWCDEAESASEPARACRLVRPWAKCSIPPEHALTVGRGRRRGGLSRCLYLYGKGGAPKVVTWAYISPAFVT